MAEDTSQIREAIEETRSDIAETMQALGEKADIKGRLSGQFTQTADSLKSTATARSEEVKAKIGATQHKVRAALADSAEPTAQALVSRLRGAMASLGGEAGRPRAIAVGSSMMILTLLVRRRRRRSMYPS